MNKQYEVMSPVGSYESLYAAMQSKADSVYFGVGKLNMRAHSANHFTIEDLPKIVEICKKRHVKAYITVNTILYDNDLIYMREIVDAAYKANVSAIIVSDVAAMMYSSRIGMAVHLSTQLNISNIEAIRFYAQFAETVVLARELTLEQVKKIYQKILEQDIRGPNGQLLRIEMFVHGALCMAISGKCYLSLHEMNTSANRGKCYQICRRGYIVKDKESDIELEIDNQYILSPKDLKTIRFIDLMMDAGIEVFKIEGRARGPEYVRIVTDCYKKAIQACCNNKWTEFLKDVLDEQLKCVFNRGFWNGYYLGQRLGEWSNRYGNRSSKKKIYLGQAINYFSKLKIGEFLMQAQTISVGDKLLITGPTTGAVFLTAEKIKINFSSVQIAKQGERFSMPVHEQIYPSDKLFKLIKNQEVL